MPLPADIAFDRIASSAIIAGMRGNFPPTIALHVSEIMLDEQIDVFELTMNSVEPIAAMQKLKQEFGDDAVVGMGTVLDVDTAKRVLDAGADFVVSPAFQPDVVQVVQDAGVLMIPGVITPSEAVSAWQMGVQLLKLFPIGALGIDYFKAMFAPLDHMRFACNGAMDADNAQAFIQAGATAAGMSGWLTGDGTWPDSRLRSRAHILQNAITMALSDEPPEREA